MAFTCTKHPYSHQYLAERAIDAQVQRLRKRRNHVPRLKPYLCRNCNKWHITSQV